MARVRVVMKREGMRALRNSPEVQAILKSRADHTRAVAMSMGVRSKPLLQYRSYVKPGRNRARAVAHTWGTVTQRHNRKYNALLKGLGG